MAKTIGLTFAKKDNKDQKPKDNKDQKPKAEGEK